MTLLELTEAQQQNQSIALENFLSSIDESSADAIRALSPEAQLDAALRLADTINKTEPWLHQEDFINRTPLSEFLHYSTKQTSTSHSGY